ncbi:alpha/beta hydrolase [Streptomyces laurentii]
MMTLFSKILISRALARFRSPVLLLAGEVDLAAPPCAMAEFAEPFPHAELVIQPRTGHFPWLDHAEQFVARTVAFLAEAAACRRPLSR